MFVSQQLGIAVGVDTFTWNSRGRTRSVDEPHQSFGIQQIPVSAFLTMSCPRLCDLD